MGFARDNTFHCWPAAQRKSSPKDWEDRRFSLIGNSFHTPSVAWLLAHVLHRHRILHKVPSVAQLDRCGPLFLAGRESKHDEANLQQLIVEDAALLLARHFCSCQSHRGGEVRQISGPSGVRPGTAHSVDAGMWRWRTLASVPWKVLGEHINILEARGILMALRCRVRSSSRFRSRFLHLTDSFVVLCALGKGRSSSGRLRMILLKTGALTAAAGLYPVFIHVRSGRNPADRPSRQASSSSTRAQPPSRLHPPQ